MSTTTRPLPPEPQITASSWIMVGILGFVWGSTFMLIEIALEGFTPFWLAAGRLIMATAVTGLYWLRLRCPLALDPQNKPTILQYFWTGAVAAGIPFLLLSWGQLHVTSGFAGTSMAAVPLVVLPLAHFLVPGEGLTLRKTLGVSMGFIGVILLLGGNTLESSGSELEFWGRVACLTVAVCYALNSVTIRRLPPVDPIGLTFMMMAAATVMTLPVAILVEGAPPQPNSRAWLAFIAIGVVSTAAMNLLRVLVIRSAGPSFMTLTNYQVPVWSVVLGSLVLAEPLPPALLWALLLILSGVAISQWNTLKRLWQRS
ncbi:MAG: DMT family transporter [Mangrovicoccus sp.]